MPKNGLMEALFGANTKYKDLEDAREFCAGLAYHSVHTEVRALPEGFLGLIISGAEFGKLSNHQTPKTETASHECFTNEPPATNQTLSLGIFLGHPDTRPGATRMEALHAATDSYSDSKEKRLSDRQTSYTTMPPPSTCSSPP